MVKIKHLIIPLVVLLTVLIDQITKILVRTLMAVDQKINIIGNFINISYVANTGAGFGLLKDQTWFLIWFSIFVIGLILFYIDKIPKKADVPIALILGGIVSNLIDRVLLGHVTDFIEISIWPTFNIADSAITIGAILLIISIYKK